MIDFKIRRMAAVLMAVAALVWMAAEPVSAQSSGQKTIIGERYVPTIWVDPDGCEHWVMDDGAEGYMTPHVRRDGTPVCRRGSLCGTMPTDQFFATDRYSISSAGKERLMQFFRETNARGYIITGHTDSRASDAYNLRLSENRANSVAKVGRSSGATIVEIRGYGERNPRVPNTSAANMAQNRRVEIICVN
ncbi:MAG: OmpA family protein [Parasphingorhabdus sp.]|uniref:OmpA family protein n=1 Tax=Parasphingorhabdus sp. TaxID=2709688 RepID=UPI003298CFCE